MSTTFERLSEIIVKTFNVPPERLTPDAPLAGLGIDSLGTVELLWEVEAVFKISLPAQPVALQTLADVARFIDELVDEARAASSTQAPCPQWHPFETLAQTPPLRQLLEMLRTLCLKNTKRGGGISSQTDVLRWREGLLM